MRLPATDRVEDWIKARSWGIDAQTLDELRLVIGKGRAADPVEVAFWLKRPAARPMPPALLAETVTWLTGNGLGSLVPVWVRRRPRAATADAGTWDESRHPRDERGRFGHGTGTPVDPTKPTLSPIGDPPSPMGSFGERLLDDAIHARANAAAADGLFTAPDGTPLKFGWGGGDTTYPPGSSETDSQVYKMTAARDVQQRMGDVDTATMVSMAYATTPGAERGPDSIAGFMWQPTGGMVPLTASDLTSESIGLRSGRVYPKDEMEPGQFDALSRDWAAGELIHSWASSSNDEYPRSLAIQDAAVREFGLEGTHDWPMSETLRGQVDTLTERYGDGYQAFVRAQYENTQAVLADAGVESLSLWRKMDLEPTTENLLLPEHFTGEQVDLRPMSAFTDQYDTAANWALGNGGVNVLLGAEVPADRILSGAGTGFGSREEGEWVLLGGGQTEFDGDHRAAYGDLTKLATNGLNEWQAANPDAIPDNWSFSFLTGNAPGGTVGYTMKDAYTGYERELVVPTDEQGVPQFEGLVPPNYFWDANERAAADTAALDSATRPAGWLAQTDWQGDPGFATTFNVQVNDESGHVVLHTPLFTVDSGAGITSSGAQDAVDTAIASYLASALNEAVSHAAVQSRAAVPSARMDGTAYAEATVVNPPSGTDYFQTETAVSTTNGTITATLHYEHTNSETDALEARIEPSITVDHAAFMVDPAATVDDAVKRLLADLDAQRADLAKFNEMNR